MKILKGIFSLIIFIFFAPVLIYGIVDFASTGNMADLPTIVILLIPLIFSVLPLIFSVRDLLRCIRQLRLSRRVGTGQEFVRNNINHGYLSLHQIQTKYNISENDSVAIMNYLKLNGYVTEEKGYIAKKLLYDESIIWNYIETTLSSYVESSAVNQNFNNVDLDYDTMNGHQFEHYCADILKRNNFVNVEVTQGSGDHGIDILAEKDSITYAIQCKCYSSNIGNAAVQQAHTGKSLYHKDIAVVLTNRYFTAQAKEDAAQLGVKLWNRDKLNEMIYSVDK